MNSTRCIINQSFKTRPGGRLGPRLGFRVLAGSPGLPGRVNSFKKKSKRRRFSKKKNKKNKSQRVCHRVLTGSAGSTRRVSRVTPGFSFPLFFINPARFRPRVGQVPGRPAGPGRVSKLCYQPIIVFKPLERMSCSFLLMNSNK